MVSYVPTTRISIPMIWKHFAIAIKFNYSALLPFPEKPRTWILLCVEIRLVPTKLDPICDPGNFLTLCEPTRSLGDMRIHQSASQAEL